MIIGYCHLLLLSCKCDDDDPRVYGINNMYKKIYTNTHICVCAGYTYIICFHFPDNAQN